MPNEIILNCLILGQTDPLPVTIDITADILSLKEAIIAEAELQIPETSLGIYKATFDFDVADEIIERDARKACKGQALKRASLLKRLFHDALQPEQVHVVAVPRRIWFVYGWNASIADAHFIPTGLHFYIVDLKQEILRSLRLEVPPGKTCTLTRVSLPMDDSLQVRLRQFSRYEKNSNRLTNNAQKVSDAFPNMNENRLRVVVELKDFESRMPNRNVKGRGSPEALLAGHNNVVNSILQANGAAKSRDAYDIYDNHFERDDGRARICPPVALYHPAFGNFLKGIETDYVPDDNFLRKTVEYAMATSKVYDSERQRQSVLQSILSELLSFPIRSDVYGDKTGPDGLAEAEGSAPAIMFIHEDNLNFGDGGSEPLARSKSSMVHDWCQSRYKKMRYATCCPTFLLATAGPWISVLGGVFTDTFIVQHLTDFVYVGVDRFLTTRRVYKVARIFHYLRQCLERLGAYYKDVTPVDTPNFARFFPPITSFMEEGPKEPVTFSYLGYLEDEPSCVTLIARRDGYPEDDRIVVKFVERYGESAHRMLVDSLKWPLAPQLYCCERLPRDFGQRKVGIKVPEKEGDFYMVIMEYIVGEPLFNAKNRLNCDAKMEIKQQMRNALQRLHDAGLVHGDVREPNVIVTVSNEAKLIDFDWAGAADQVKYPPLLSLDIDWAKGVQNMGIIRTVHDLEMLDKFFP